MSSYLAAHHPMDPGTPEFDFWGWRLTRRLMTDQLRQIAVSAQGAAPLAAVANALELEKFTNEHVVVLERFFSRRITNLDALAELLDGVVRPGQIPMERRSMVPMIRPEWMEITPTRAMFSGKVNGVPLVARLPESMEVVPPYQVVWVTREGAPKPTGSLDQARMGPHLSYAKPVWDWLFARRLTLYCIMGVGTWPDPDAPPLVIGEDWQAPWRAL